jgi:hypothetical protein
MVYHAPSVPRHMLRGEFWNPFTLPFDLNHLYPSWEKIRHL